METTLTLDVIKKVVGELNFAYASSNVQLSYKETHLLDNMKEQTALKIGSVIYLPTKLKAGTIKVIEMPPSSDELKCPPLKTIEWMTSPKPLSLPLQCLSNRIARMTHTVQ